MNDIDQHLLNDFQRDFPLCPRPYAALGRRLGISERAVIQNLERLQAGGAVSRVGPIFAPGRVGASTLAAIAAPEATLESVAELISSYPEVNHNYEREHRYNLWFVVTAPNQSHLEAVLTEIEVRSGLAVMVLPLLKDYHIDLGFPLELT